MRHCTITHFWWRRKLNYECSWKLLRAAWLKLQSVETFLLSWFNESGNLLNFHCLKQSLKSPWKMTRSEWKISLLSYAPRKINLKIFPCYRFQAQKDFNLQRVRIIVSLPYWTIPHLEQKSMFLRGHKFPFENCRKTVLFLATFRIGV